MDWPGEKLLARFWETVEKAGVGILAPWQIRRVGRADIDVERKRRLLEAQTRLDVRAILSGEKLLAGEELLENTEPATKLLPREARFLMAQRAIVGDELRSQVNIAKALLVAESELRNDPQEPPDEGLDDDWFFRWRKQAGEASAEQLHNVWGKILTGEIKSPGSFSLRTLDRVRNLSQEDVLFVDKIAPYVIGYQRDDFIVLVAPAIEDITLDVRFHLADIGVITESYSVARTKVTTRSLSADRYVQNLRTHDVSVIVEHEDPRRELALDVWKLTSTGRELIRISRPVVHERYLKLVAEAIRTQGFDVTAYKGVWISKTEFRPLKKLAS